MNTKTLKNWKSIDIWGQITMLLLPVGYALITGNAGVAISAFFTVGGWQLISSIIHLPLMKEIWIVRSRFAYNRSILTLAAIGLVSIMIDRMRPAGELIIYELLALLFVGFVLGIWYFCNTVVEYNRVAVLKTTSRFDIFSEPNEQNRNDGA